MGSLSHYFQAKKYMSGGVGSPSINSMEDNLNEALIPDLMMPDMTPLL